MCFNLLERCTDGKLMKLAIINSTIKLEKCQGNFLWRKRLLCDDEIPLGLLSANWPAQKFCCFPGTFKYAINKSMDK